jgi:hypothetical protein
MELPDVNACFAALPDVVKVCEFCAMATCYAGSNGWVRVSGALLIGPSCPSSDTSKNQLYEGLFHNENNQF